MAIFPLILLIVGITACSTAALMIKASHADPLLIAAWRLLIAGALLSPLFFRARRRYPAYPTRQLVWMTLPSAILLAAHFWSWNLGVHMTIIANASLIVNMTAPVMPVIIWITTRERARPMELVGTAIAFGGSLILGVSDLNLDREYFLGDIVCFGSMLTFAFYLAWSRRQRQLPSIWLYAPPVYFMAGMACLLAGWIKTGSPMVHEPREWLLFAALALIPTMTGHSILNHAMQRLPSQLVATMNLGQFIPAAALAWPLFHEKPSGIFAIAALLVIAGALVVIRSHDTARNNR
jgi:drug/metabolite transporter (DMT)-like permease